MHRKPEPETEFLVAGCAPFSPAGVSAVEKYEAALRERMGDPRFAHRLEHSLSVARCAETLALIYDVDPFKARVAGTLHDWDKVLSKSRQIHAARENCVDLGVDLELVAPLLHGLTAECELSELFPELGDDVLRAIARHTIGAVDMSPLDMVIFVADGIEPTRPAVPRITQARGLVGNVSLDELFWDSFTSGIQYVIETGRYLYPGTLDIYNELVLTKKAAAAV